jgi:hypothetical protein
MSENINRINESRDTYYRRSLELGPSPFLALALEFATNKDAAIDIGAGAMLDTKQIAENGFKDIFASDVNQNIENYFPPELKDKAVLKIEDINDYNYPPNSFDLVYTSKALHYLKQVNSDTVFQKILASIRRDGLFVGAIFGRSDEQEDAGVGYFPTRNQLKSKFPADQWDLIRATSRPNESPDPAYESLNLFGIIARKL